MFYRGKKFTVRGVRKRTLTWIVVRNFQYSMVYLKIMLTECLNAFRYLPRACVLLFFLLPFQCRVGIVAAVWKIKKKRKKKEEKVRRTKGVRRVVLVRLRNNKHTVPYWECIIAYVLDRIYDEGPKYVLGTHIIVPYIVRRTRAIDKP